MRACANHKADLGKVLKVKSKSLAWRNTGDMAAASLDTC